MGTTNGTVRIDVESVIDSARFIGIPLSITAVMVCMMLVDGFDLQTISFVAPRLVTDWGIKKSMLAPVLAASLIGMAVGSVALGWLADRIGRRGSYIICLACLFAGSLGSAYARSLSALFVARVITGIGLGGATPLAATMISEWTPKRSRSVAVACAVVAVPLGGMIGASVAQWVIPAFGWRSVFFVGAALPLLFFLMAYLLLPESPKFLAAHPKRHGLLARSLNRLLQEERFTGSEIFAVDEPSASQGNALSLLVTRPLLATTLWLWAAFALNTLGLYAFVNWLPTVMSTSLFSLHASLEGSKLFNFGAFFGAVGGAALIGVYGSRLVGTSLSIMGAIATFFIGTTIVSTVGSHDWQLFGLVFLAGVSLNGMQTMIYTVAAHSYPTHIRATGVGIAQTASRLGGVLSSALGGAFFAIRPQLPISDFFFAVTTVVVLVAISFYALRVHIHGRRLSLSAA